MQIFFYLLMAIIAGLLIPVQSGLNAQLGNAVKSPTYGALLSFVVGTIALLLYCVVTRVDFSNLKQGFELPWYYFTGGVMGAFFVLTLIVVPPQLGMAVTLGITIAAQLLLGLVMDHYGLLGSEVARISWEKAAGAALIVVGVFMLRN